LPEPEFSEATGVLEMIARSPEQENLYQSRLKAQRDDVAKLKFAKQQGHQEGRQEGEGFGRIQGQIQLLEQLLGLPESKPEDFAGVSLERLTAQANELQRQLRDRSVPS